ncbi:hypothetical protein SAMN05444339_10288 [Loktanella atrilutea]|uniref:Phage protein D n=1 Tax=Loktanella atrilutea TaxID=366533 RepID=A0A1M4WEC4_LOKAT|nr:contractile injection system protein, VgrG/Pvc8 family [Loktanella atrilutea]SHE79641.1 hypothetical protein SAMN05444339_10288 [Loktanella atrilutea]
MSRPQIIITVDGKPVSGVFTERLMSVTVMDEEGLSADRVELELADDPPAELPKPGAIISVQMGYAGSGAAFMGEFIAEEIEIRVLPYALRITGKSADLGGDTKDQKERHFDDITLGDLVKKIASEGGLKSSVAPEIASFRYEWIGQIGESNVAFLERIAKRHNALFSIKNQTVIFAVRGSGLTPTGLPLTPYVITRATLAPGSASFVRSERTRYEDVIACYMDRATGKRVEVKVPAEKSGTGSFTMDQPFASKGEAEAAAKSKAKQLLRQGFQFSATVVGDPTIRGGSVVTFANVRSGIDGVAFTVRSAVHRFDKRSGYTTQISGELQE